MYLGGNRRLVPLMKCLRDIRWTPISDFAIRKQFLKKTRVYLASINKTKPRQSPFKNKVKLRVCV